MLGLFVKIGPKGSRIRPYTKCCGTQLGGVETKAAFRNAHCLFTKNGTSYEPTGIVPNIQASSAFDKDIIPEPKSSMAPFSFAREVLPLFVNPFASKFSASHDALFCDKDAAQVEVVPITYDEYS
jgi:hypothetical protein